MRAHRESECAQNESDGRYGFLRSENARRFDVFRDVGEALACAFLEKRGSAVQTRSRQL